MATTRRLDLDCEDPRYFIAWKIGGGTKQDFRGGALVTIKLTPPPIKKARRRKAR
jgi:hypothetical protein